MARSDDDIYVVDKLANQIEKGNLSAQQTITFKQLGQQRMAALMNHSEFNLELLLIDV